ncbi:MAG: hypothetical protein M1371_00670 [Actinobacteria bacterium]|nr:hypothetical protein [Actinomycetota bacterium]
MIHGNAVSLTLIIVLLFSFTFVFGDITKPLLGGTQPLALKVTRLNPEEEKVYDYIRKLPGDFRIVYLPSAGISWPGDTNLSYEWTSAYVPKPELLRCPYHPLNREIISSLYSWMPNNHLGKLLGLASVKYLVYSRYEFFVSAIDFESTYMAGPVIDVVNGYANAWYIDPKEIGKENFTITLYFRPLSYFYLGLFISGLTLIGCVAFLFWSWWKVKKQKTQIFNK